MGELKSLSDKSISDLGLSPEVEGALKDIQAELGDAYRDGFVAMVSALNKQASALSRIQNTLNILVESIAPQLKGQVPSAFGIAQNGDEADLARALIVTDPIAAGFTLSQQDLAKALNVSAVDVSVVVRALELTEDESCAVTVRNGKRSKVVNYHPRAIERFKELISDSNLKGLKSDQKSAIKRVRRQLSRAQ